MRAEAAAISESEPDRRLHVPRAGDELTRLARTLNAMLGRLQEALRREQRFVDQASHELRTPLAILKAELDVTLARPRGHAEQETALRAAAEETDRLVLLAEDLLVLARTRDGRLPVRRTPTPLRPLIEGAAAPFGAEVGPVPDETVLVDPVRLRQALHNLLDNAVRHGRPPVRVAARRDHALLITVEDAGPGFDGRPEGLGLTVVRAVAESHSGHVLIGDQIGDHIGDGARVELVLDA
jgi:signal transduction histidine kinase